MAIIEVKYSIGDVVWHANTTTEAKQHPCPDCKDTRKWAAVSPAGNDYTFACPRCSTSYSSHDELSLKYTAYVPTARRLTIGSVRYDSKPFGADASAAQYMCVETGVGGGSVYDESRLFLTEAEALAAAEQIASKANSEFKHIVDRYNRTLEISDYQLESGLLKLVADKRSEMRSLFYGMNDLFEVLAEAEDKDAILEAVEDYKRYQWERDKAAATTAFQEAPHPTEGAI